MAAERIGVIGNCQAHGISECLQSLLPRQKIVSFALVELRRSNQIERAGAEARECDLILTSRGDAIDVEELRQSSLESSGVRCISFPTVVFFGFHPDTIVSFRATGRKLFSGISANHSKLAMACYLLGLSARDTAALYNSYVFSVLGYFDEFNKAAEGLRRSFSQHDLQSPDLTGWCEEGSFMYTPNHPKQRVLWSLAEQLCLKIAADVHPSATPPQDDWLAAGLSWPVYPEIARRIGVRGDTIFRRTAGAPVDLDTFVELSFTAYRNVPADALSVPEVQAAVDALRAEGIGRTQYWSGSLMAKSAAG